MVSLKISPPLYVPIFLFFKGLKPIKKQKGFTLQSGLVWMLCGFVENLFYLKYKALY